MRARARAAGSADPAHAGAIEEQRTGSYGHQQHRQARRHAEAGDKGRRAVMAAIDDYVAGDGDQELERAIGKFSVICRAKLSRRALITAPGIVGCL